MKPLIIIGTGLAGYTLAREFRKLDKATPLLILTADDGGFYSKPMLSNAFAQGKRAEQLVSHTAAHMAAQLSATILTRVRVLRLDSAAKTVITGSGAFDYDRLVIATGAQPVRLGLEGDAAQDVISVNHISDYAALRGKLDAFGGPARVAIIGAGLIGCEFADDLAGAGHEVTVIDPNERPLAALAPPALSRGLLSALSARRVAFRLGTSVRRVERDEGAYLLTLADGRLVDADLVLSAVGLRPDLQLAKASELAVGRGIIVDAYGRTFVPDVYALGDCAEYATPSGPRLLPYVAPLMTAARAIAQTLSGKPAEIDLKPAPVIVKTLSFPLALLSPAQSNNGAWQETQYGERIICRYYNGDGVMVGFGVAPQDANIRQALMGELGTSRVTLAA